jgi:hypothetical protein
MVKQKKSLIILFVTCSLTRLRANIAMTSAKSIIDNFASVSDFATLVNLDNGSKFTEHFDILPKSTTKICFRNNIGYWQALHWFLAQGMFELELEEAEYLYIIESDNFHTSLFELRDIIALMNRDQEIVSTRTQEFYVKFSWFFDKEKRLNPVRSKRSLVALKNLVSGESATFTKISKNSNLYKTNLHAKLPAVNRIKNLRIAFQALQQMEIFTEHDFFVQMQTNDYQSAILDGGLYYTLVNSRDKELIESGSWIDKFKGEKSEYLPTRKASIKDVTDPIYRDYEIN